jgi:hypothetical protein
MSDWVFYSTSRGRAIVRDEITKILPKRGAVALATLLERIKIGDTLPRDVGRLNADLLEARLTFNGQEFRVHFARSTEDGRPILLALRAVNKKARKASPQDIQTSLDRLRDWNTRQSSA